MRNIFTVSAYVVDANGTFNYLSGYPKNFDSRSYNDDVAKARKRANGDFSEAWGAMCKNDTRMVQTVTLTNIFGQLLDSKSMGTFPEDAPEQAETE